MTTALSTLTKQLAQNLGMVDSQELMTTLKATAFKGQVSDSQMAALLIVANQYGLNPWTREIYPFPDKNNGIVPVVGVDGWSRIINGNLQFDGIEFEQDDESCTCKIYRKDRNHPTSVTEYLSECRRATGPWQSHPKRMLRHKAMIQCARLAFGYVGIYDQDEAERLAEIKEINPQRQVRQSAMQIAQQAQTVESTPERDKLIADLELIVLEQGQDAYGEAFSRLSKASRLLLGAEDHQRIWAMGEKND